MLNNGKITEFRMKSFLEIGSFVEDKNNSKRDRIKQYFLYRIHNLYKNFPGVYYSIIQKQRYLYNPCIRITKDMPRTCQSKFKELHEIMRIFKLQDYEEFMTGFIMMYNFPYKKLGWSKEKSYTVYSCEVEMKKHEEALKQIESMGNFQDAEGKYDATLSCIEDMYPHAESLYKEAISFKEFLREKLLPEISGADRWKGFIDKIHLELDVLDNTCSYVEQQCQNFIREDDEISSDTKKYLNMLRDARGSINDFIEFFECFNSNTQRIGDTLRNIAWTIQFNILEGKELMDSYAEMVGYINRRKKYQKANKA